MKRNTLIIAATLAALTAAAPARAQQNKEDVDQKTFEREKVEYDNAHPETPADTPALPLDSLLTDDDLERITPWQRDSLRLANQHPEPYAILLIARPYNDRIVLRWAPSDYAPWRYLNDDGYVVVRTALDSRSVTADTLAVLRPLTLDGFKQQFAQDDSLAAVAAELLYGEHVVTGQTAAPPGTMGAVAEVHDEQQTIVGLAMMISERRPDLAAAMGLMYTDRDVRPGVSYTYSVRPGTPESVLPIDYYETTELQLADYQARPLDVVITDSISAPRTIVLSWPREGSSAYDIERRTEGGQWQRLNKQPYVSFVNVGLDAETAANLYADSPDWPGVYEYRIAGYDAFGDKTLPSAPHRVELPDLEPPVPPVITRIVVDHPDPEHAYATIYLRKDTMEADVKGYLPLYRHERVDDGEWRPLTDQLTLPGDTVCRADVSGLPTGAIVMGCYDEAGNLSLSLPQMILLEDYLPPSPPSNLRANVAPDGYLVLRWSASPEADVAYYEVFSANDPTDVFMNRTNPDQRDTLFTDSLAMGLNQAYIYYKVRAVDLSGNSSADSEVLRVVRPNYIPPSVCRIDSVWVTDEIVNMWWLQSGEADLAYHRLFRKLDGADTWTLVGVYSADSLRRTANRIRFADSPRPNLRRRYVYAVETVNLSGVTSGLSQPQTFLFAGPRVVSVPLKLFGSYARDNSETRLAWETGAVPDYGPWHYCVYRKGPGDQDFQFLLAVESGESQFADRLLSPGQTAEYYLTVRYDDGRRSQRSNVVSITAPK